MTNSGAFRGTLSQVCAVEELLGNLITGFLQFAAFRVVRNVHRNVRINFADIKQGITLILKKKKKKRSRVLLNHKSQKSLTSTISDTLN